MFQNNANKHRLLISVAVLLFCFVQSNLVAQTFSTQSSATFPAPLAPGRVTVGDFDNDDDGDILYQTGADGSVFKFARSNGNGTFTDQAIGASPFAGVTLVNHNGSNYHVADFDKDGDQDIWAGVNNTTGSYYRNDNGVFTTQSSATFPLSAVSSRAVAGDFDKDGDADFLYQVAGNGSAFKYARSNGNGTFTDVAIGSSPFAGLTLLDNNGTNYHIADFDGDGDVDVWAGVNGAQGSYYRNDNGTFTSQSTATFPAPLASGRITVSDYDTDGDGDMLYQTGGNGTPFQYARSNGDGTFTIVSQAASPFATVTLADHTGLNYYIEDFDNDDDFDVWAAAASASGSFYSKDDAPPSLVSFTPVNNATGVSLTTNITYTFSESVVKGTGNITIVRVSDNVTVETISVTSGQVTGSGTTWTINPSITLDPSTQYAIKSDAGTFENAGGTIFGGVTLNNIQSFRTLTTLNSVTVPADGTYKLGDNLDFSVNFSENITVNTAGGTPFIAITIGATVRNAVYVSGSGTGVLVFRYTVATGDVDNNGIAVGSAITLNGGTLIDISAANAPVTLNNVGSTVGVLVDGVVPVVNTINRQTPLVELTNSPTLIYRVTFSESVSNVDISDFELTATGTAMGTIASVSAATGSTIDVTVNGVSGSGTLRLDLKASGTGITDASGNAIAGYTSGETYTLDNTAPVITSDGGGATADISLAENLTSVTTVTATDDNPVTYSLNGGADEAKFSITAGGVLTFGAAPDFEIPTDADVNNTYVVIVRVSDGLNAVDQTITVTITDVNDNSPVITSNGGGATATISQAENTTAVTTVTATDADAGIITYSLNGGADEAKFSITAAGVLTFAAAPDFETPTDAGADNTYVVIVRASDGLNTDDQTITVTITDVNDNSPVITSNGGGATASISQAENTTAVTTVTATDADADAITFSLNGGADEAKFSITAAGVLTFAAAPDFETPTDVGANNTYVVIVRASDGLNTDDQTITVTITDVNDVAPVITSNSGGATASISQAENITAVTMVTATDADAGTITYSLNGGADEAKFSITAAGVLTFAAAPDFETPTDVGANNTYVVIVRASDGLNTDDQTITVTITDVNDVAPVITSNSGGATASISQAENITAVTTVTATDADAGTITYSLNGGADEAKFSITAAGVLTFAAAPDFETPTDVGANNTYVVIVRASDGLNTDDQTITVTITNVNDIAPVITSDGGGASATIAVLETSTDVTTVTAMDGDAGATMITYSLNGGADEGHFNINSATGEVTFKLPPVFVLPTDANGDNVYEVIVRASDGALNDDQAIDVEVSQGSLPVLLTDLRGYKNGNGIEVAWKTASEINVDRFEIERSIDGRSFTKVGKVAAKGNGSASTAYNWQDVNPVQSANFYRLKIVDKNGAWKHSSVVRVSLNGKWDFIKVLPNPVRDKFFGLQLNNIKAGRYELSLYNTNGQKVFARTIEYAGGAGVVDIKLPSLVGAGMYNLQLLNSKERYNATLLVE